MSKAEHIDKYKWKKGQSGNPKGRPKKIPDLHSSLAMIMSEEQNEKSALDAILLRLRAEALKGNLRAAELLLRYCYPNGIESTAQSVSYEIVWGKDTGDGSADTN
jgi:hypothetical protein